MVGKPIAVREWYEDVPRKTYVPTTAGILSIVVFILGFGYWSNSALIAGAIITSGAFVTTGQNKISSTSKAASSAKFSSTKATSSNRASL